MQEVPAQGDHSSEVEDYRSRSRKAGDVLVGVVVCMPHLPGNRRFLGLLCALECWLMFKVASWNLNSVRSRLTHVTTWLKAREPDVLLLQELKGTEFPSEVFVTTKICRGDGEVP